MEEENKSFKETWKDDMAQLDRMTTDFLTSIWNNINVKSEKDSST